MKRIPAIIGVVALAIAMASTTSSAVGAEEQPPTDLVIGYPPPCGDLDEVSNSGVECAGIEPVDSIGTIAPEIQAAAQSTARNDIALVAAKGPEALRNNCRLHAEVAFYAAEDWNRLAQNLAAQASHCAEYFISIPPLTSNKTNPRPNQAWRIRGNGPRFHAMAEAHLASWQSWVIANGKTWIQAGQEFRRRMAAAGYDISLGDTWALNEVPSEVRRGDGQARRNLLDFLHGLYEGEGTEAATKGLVFIAGFGQRTLFLDTYLTNMRGWLADTGFWTEVDGYVRFWAQEVYGDIRAWGVPETPSMTRARHLAEYVMHPITLARAGGEQTAAAEVFLRRTYVPIANAAWRWQSKFGFTNVDHLLMRHFLSEQVFAIRHDAGTHPAEGPEGRLGFAWAPDNELKPAESDFAQKTAGLLERVASALANAYARGGSSQMGACGPPGDHIWCEGTYEGSVFNEGWHVFANPWT